MKYVFFGVIFGTLYRHEYKAEFQLYGWFL